MSTYTDSLGLEEITPGSQAGLWGNTTNNNLILIDQAITGVTPLSFAGASGTTITLDGAVGTVNTARSAVLNITGTATGANTVVIPNVQKTYLVRNNTGQSITFQTAAPGDTYAVLSGNSILIFCDGNNNVYTGIVSPSSGTLTVSGGGTGATGFGAGGFIKSSGGTANLTASTYVALASEVSGTLPVLNGGTGVGGFTSGALIVGNGTSPLAVIAGSASGQVLTYNGSSWQPRASGLTPGSYTNSNIVVNADGIVTAISTGSGGSGVTSIAGSNIGVSPASGAVTITLSGSNVTSALGYTPVSLTSANTMTGSGSLFATGTTIGDQRIGVGYAGLSSGLSAQAIQLGAGGYGAIYVPAGTGYDGYANVGFIAGSGGSSFSISNDPSLTLYAGAYTCYKGGVSTAWVIYTSDARSKENVTPYTKGLSELKQINPKNWEYNGLAGTRAGDKGTGLIAQEIYEVVPSMRVTRQGKLHPTDVENTDIYTVDTSEMTWILTNAVKELSAKIDAQSAEIASLKAKVG